MKLNKGFTLIEILIYLALFSIIIGGVLVTAYQVIEASHKTASRVVIEEEANFLLRKIEWALSAVSLINAPAAGMSGSTLSINKVGFSASPIIFELDSSNLRIKKYAEEAAILNSSRVSISNLTFHHLAAGGNKPAGIRVNFQVNDQLFELIKYLRK